MKVLLLILLSTHLGQGMKSIRASCAGDDFNCQISEAEYEYLFFHNLKYTDKAVIVLEFRNSIDAIVKKSCQHLLTNSSKESATYKSNHTQIDVICALSSANEHTWHFETSNTSALDRYRNRNVNSTKKISLQIFPGQSSKCRGRRHDMTCYAVITRFDLGHPLIFEGVMVTNSSNGRILVDETVGGNEPDIDLSTFFTLEAKDILKDLELVSTQCSKLDAGERKHNLTHFYCNFQIPNRTKAVYDDLCNCTARGIYRELYFDVIPEENDHFVPALDIEGISFWINVSYTEKIASRRKPLESFLLSQILEIIANDTEGKWNANNTVLKLIPRNSTATLTILYFTTNSTNRTVGEVNDVCAVIDRLLLTASLVLEVNENNETFFIPPQLVIRNPYGETHDDTYSESPEDKVFLWFVFTVVILITIVILVVAIRKHKRDSEESVEPMTFPSDFGFSEGRYQRYGSNLQGVVSARSMTTILSESTEASEENVSVGTNSYQYEEDPRPTPSAFQVGSGGCPNPISDEEDLNTIYYLAPPPGGNQNSAFP